MRCDEVVERIIAQRGRLAPGPEIESHLRECQGCRRVHREQQALWREMDAWEPPEVSASFDRELFARIGRRLAAPWLGLEPLSRFLSPLRPAFPAALACMLLIATAVVQNGRYMPVPADPSVAAQAWEREQLQQIDLALDDIQMLSEFDILPLQQTGEGKS